MWGVTLDLHGVEERSIAVGVSRVGVEFDAVTLDGELGEGRCSGLPEHTGEEVEVVGDLVLAVLVLHILSGVRIIPFASAGSTDEVERSLVGYERTSLLACHVGVGVDGYSLHIGDGIGDHGSGVGVNGSNDFVAVVVSLNGEVDLTLLENRQHELAEERCLGVHGVSGAGENILVRQSDTVLGVGMECYLLAEPVRDIVGEVSRGERGLIVTAALCTPPVL